MNYNITVNYSEGSFSITGSEEFIEKTKNEINEMLLKVYVKKQKIEEVIAASKEENSNNITIASKSNEKYINKGIFNIDTDDGEITILKKVPGKNNAEKTKNVALIVLYAKGENERIKGSEIKGLCEKQKCYDQKNFAAIFKRDMSNFVMKGKGQSWTLQLSVPGKESAIELLESMCSDD